MVEVFSAQPILSIQIDINNTIEKHKKKKQKVVNLDGFSDLEKMLTEVHKVLASVPQPKLEPLQKPEFMATDNMTEGHLKQVSTYLKEITDAIEKYSSELNSEVENTCARIEPVQEGEFYPDFLNLYIFSDAFLMMQFTFH